MPYPLYELRHGVKVRWLLVWFAILGELKCVSDQCALYVVGFYLCVI